MKAKDDHSSGIDRRSFLALGTAVAAAATLPAAALAETSPLGVTMTGGGPISVGYVAGSDAWVKNLDLPWDEPNLAFAEFALDIVPATSLDVGSELGGALIELTVHGLFPRLPHVKAMTWKKCFLFASMPAPPEMIFGPDPVPFLAWSARSDPQPSQAAKVRPVLPTGADGALSLELEVHPLSPGKGSRASGEILDRSAPRTVSNAIVLTTNFTVDRLAGRPRLQEGVYLLALGRGLWDEAWSGTFEELRRLDGLDSVAIGIRLLE
ncbi:MAG: hypothetical protein ABI639_05105 [Thermoanaerobaculia bacterium]